MTLTLPFETTPKIQTNNQVRTGIFNNRLRLIRAAMDCNIFDIQSMDQITKQRRNKPGLLRLLKYSKLYFITGLKYNR